jgi:ATP-dependent DNA helicase RecG
MNRKEKFNLEWKRQVNDSFLKTVSAYSNYNDGEIIFGVDDSGEIVGLQDAENQCLRIENMINDSIEPVPDFKLDVQQDHANTIVILLVKKGLDTPYYYKGKAYKRSDTSTLEVSRFELRRLAIEGVNLSYEGRRASSGSLSFKVLESELKQIAGIKSIDLDILRTLNLYHKDGYYNIAGELLADENNIGFSGIDIARFGKDVSQILFRETINKKSLITQFRRTMEVFELFYQYEEVEGYSRVRKELIPKEAFREAVANAIVHRVWDVNAYIKISMYDDRIEVNSPGGLPKGLTEEEYMFGNISVLRNPIIAGVFYRLNLIEQFGTGIARINKEYTHNLMKPNYVISENNIMIRLPVSGMDKTVLPEDEMTIYDILKESVELSREDIGAQSDFNKSKTIRVIQRLLDRNIIEKLGKGPAVTYRLK